MTSASPRPHQPSAFKVYAMLCGVLLNLVAGFFVAGHSLWLVGVVVAGIFFVGFPKAWSLPGVLFYPAAMLTLIIAAATGLL